MNDTISRLAVIQIIEKMRARIGHNLERSIGKSIIEILDDVGRDINGLPSALGTNLAEVGTDCISRQQAIDALSDLMIGATESGFIWIYRDDAYKALEQLPSVQSESFEWCIDCKEYDQEAHCCHRWSKMIRKTIEEIRGTTAIGEWVKVHGFATPGGDPVWKCSNCGKGVHVYGIEHGTYGADIADNQWVACPNCGAVMIGESDG